eukprot:g3085.t1
MRRITARLFEPAKRVRCELGEAPIWDDRVRGGRLLWVDVMSARIFVYQGGDVEEHRLLEHTRYVSTVVPSRDQRDTVILGTKEGFAKYNLSTKIFTPHPSNPIHSAGMGCEARMNDGKVDPSGRLWCGSLVRSTKDLDLVPGAAALYVLEGWSAKSPPKKVLSGVTCSNGIAWTTGNTSSERRMYWTDSPTFNIDMFAFGDGKANLDTIVASRKSVIRVSESFPPVADGLVVDVDGFVWAAHFGGGYVLRYDPCTGRPVARIDLPISEAGDQCTAVAWGGPSNNDLFITTAHEFWDEEKKRKYPSAGKMFYVPASDIEALCRADTDNGEEVRDSPRIRIGVAPGKFG